MIDLTTCDELKLLRATIKQHVSIKSFYIKLGKHRTLNTHKKAKIEQLIKRI